MTTSEPTTTTTNTGDNKTLKAAYLVGITENGELIFQTSGESVGVLELLGLHGVASIRIKALIDSNQGLGDALTLKVLTTLQEALVPAPESSGEQKVVS